MLWMKPQELPMALVLPAKNNPDIEISHPKKSREILRFFGSFLIFSPPNFFGIDCIRTLYIGDNTNNKRKGHIRK